MVKKIGKFFLISLVSSSAFANDKIYLKSPKSKLNLRLVGTIVYSDNKKSIASINSGSYRTSETISDQAEVVKISRLKVYIKNKINNSIEYITTGKFLKDRSVNKQDIYKNEKKEYHVNRKLIDKVTGNLSEFLNDAGTKIIKDDSGSIKGFEITYIKKNGVFDNGLGLKVGDQLLNVNNIPLDSISSVMKLLDQFKKSSIINLGLNRNGITKNIRYLVR